MKWENWLPVIIYLVSGVFWRFSPSKFSLPEMMLLMMVSGFATILYFMPKGKP